MATAAEKVRGAGGVLLFVCPTCGARVSCGNCNEPLEDRPGGWHNRRVPRKGGKRLPVCPTCASAIDRQGELDVDEESAT